MEETRRNMLVSKTYIMECLITKRGKLSSSTKVKTNVTLKGNPHRKGAVLEGVDDIYKLTQLMMRESTDVGTLQIH